MRRFAGIGLILVASLSFSIMGAATKMAVPVEGALPTIFWRSVFVAVVALVILARSGTSIRPGNLRLLLVRSGVGLLAMVCFFWSLGQIPLGTANTLLYTSPLFMVLFAGVFLGEERRAGTLPMACVAFVGVALVMQPSRFVFDWGIVAGLAAGFLAALAYLSVRKLRTTDPPARIVVWFALVSALVTAPFVFSAELPDTSLRWGWLLAVGLFATGGQLCMTQAYRVEQAHVVGPFSYATVIFSYVLGLVFWGEEISLEAGVGVLMVVGAGAVLSAGAKARPPRPGSAARAVADGEGGEGET